MHYKNGREAKTGDSVVYKSSIGVIAGTLHSLVAGSNACNAQISFPVPGTCTSWCVTVGECFHAEDAFNAVDATIPAATAPAAA
jgi:hypothetical protein